MDNRYRLTEYGLVANFQQACGCNAEGPKCKEGRKLYEAYEKACSAYLEGKITLSFLDTFLGKWQEHLGA